MYLHLMIWLLSGDLGLLEKKTETVRELIVSQMTKCWPAARGRGF